MPVQVRGHTLRLEDIYGESEMSILSIHVVARLVAMDGASIVNSGRF